MNSKRLKTILQHSIRTETVLHAYLIEDPTGEDSGEVVEAFIAALMCRDEDPANRPCGVCDMCRQRAAGGMDNEDIIRIFPDEKNSIKVKAISDMHTHLMKKSYWGMPRLAIVSQAHLMNETAQNKLLKLLEEPPGKSVIIMTTGSAEAMLPTIRSRSAVYKLTPEDGLDTLNSSWSREITEFFSLISSGAPFYRTSPAADRCINAADGNAAQFLEQVLLYTRAELLKGAFTPDFAGKVVKYASSALEDIQAGMKKEYIIRDMLLKIDSAE